MGLTKNDIERKIKSFEILSKKIKKYWKICILRNVFLIISVTTLILTLYWDIILKKEFNFGNLQKLSLLISIVCGCIAIYLEIKRKSYFRKTKYITKMLAIIPIIIPYLIHT